MAEIVKKTRAHAKRKNPAKKETAATDMQVVAPSHGEIADLAQKFWVERCWQDGYVEQDWLRAERELQSITS